MLLKTLDSILEIARSKPPARMVVAAAEDDHALYAVREGVKEGIISPVLVGNRKLIEEICSRLKFSLEGINIIEETNPVISSEIAVSLIRKGEADILMKGLVGTADMLRKVLDRENGIGTGSIMSHAAMVESKNYHKLFCITDAGMIVAPDLKDKSEIIKNAVGMYKKIGLTNPKVAILAAVELLNEEMQATTDAAMLVTMNRRGQIRDCIIDGPMAFDTVVSKEACEHKGLKTEVGGDTDIIVFPNIETGNSVYKALAYLGEAVIASVILGASVPVIVTSRSDSDMTKFMSVALAAAMR